jgi:hypothetical protein
VVGYPLDVVNLLPVEDRVATARTVEREDGDRALLLRDVEAAIRTELQRGWMIEAGR